MARNKLSRAEQRRVNEQVERERAEFEWRRLFEEAQRRARKIEHFRHLRGEVDDIHFSGETEPDDDEAQGTLF